MTYSPPPDDQACAVCGRILFSIDGGWHHAFPDLLEEDHPPVPVSRSEIPDQLRPRCDFCSAEFPEFILPVAPILLPGVPGIRQQASTADWGACADCAAALERNQWNAVLRRSLDAHEAKYGPPQPEIEQALRALHRSVRKNITGALRRAY